MRQIFLDTETTGLSPDAGDRVIEIGCVEYAQRKPTGRVFHHYLNPERSSSPEALAVHGIADDFLATKPKFAELAAELLAFVSGAELIIHNAPFDMGFLNAEYALAGQAGALNGQVRVTDSLRMAKQLWPGKRNGLDALCDRLGVDNSGRTFHGALLDAQLLAEVYIGMTRGQDALAIDSASIPQAGQGLARTQLDASKLVVIKADDNELQAHQAVLVGMAKANGKPPLWAALDAAAAQAEAVA